MVQRRSVAINHAAALALLNSTAVCVDVLARSRNQGGGLAKLQLFEYRETRVPDWTAFSKKALARFAGVRASVDAVTRGG